jgi:hypothetical protein
MKLKTLVLTILFFFSTGFYATWDFHYPIAEPDIKTCVGWDVTHSGLLQLSYDLNGNKKPVEKKNNIVNTKVFNFIFKNLFS